MVPPELAELVSTVRRAFPEGVTDEDYWALLDVLWPVLSERNLGLVVAEVTGREPVVVRNDAAAARSVARPTPDRVAAARRRLEDQGLALTIDATDEEPPSPSSGGAGER